MTNCKGCNEPTQYSYSAAYGGDHYYSCSVCEWHCEQERSEQTTIKQGLALEELVAHKKKLNLLYDRLHRYAFTTLRNIDEPKDMLDELRNIMNELIETEE